MPRVSDLCAGAVPRACAVAHLGFLNTLGCVSNHATRGAGLPAPARPRRVARVRRPTCDLADHLGWRARHHRVRRDGLEHQAACRDLRALAHADVAQHSRACADDHAVGDLGVAVAVVLAGAPQRHVLCGTWVGAVRARERNGARRPRHAHALSAARCCCAAAARRARAPLRAPARAAHLQQRHVVADDRRLADDHARAVVQEDAAATAGCWVDVHAEHLRRAARARRCARDTDVARSPRARTLGARRRQGAAARALAAGRQQLHARSQGPPPCAARWPRACAAAHDAGCCGTHARTHACMHTHAHACARTHARTHAHARTHTSLMRLCSAVAMTLCPRCHSALAMRCVWIAWYPL
jgi:hypothetical protein